MNFRIFSLHPSIFSSFMETSLIARGVSKSIINFELVNWRDSFGVGNYKQIDDRAFGGGSGMVLQADPIFNALKEKQAVSDLFQILVQAMAHARLQPNNATFYKEWLVASGMFGSADTSKTRVLNPKKVTISLTPRGFPLKQKTVEWLAEFEEINILCGRYEGFDSRVSEIVDLELSIGDFVLNGGEVAAMSLVESVSRLVPGFITKFDSVIHDSFSSGLNYYDEQKEYSKAKNPKTRVLNDNDIDTIVKNMFDDDMWLEQIAPQIEHPQYTRPIVWNNYEVPAVLRGGDHRSIQGWRQQWYK